MKPDTPAQHPAPGVYIKLGLMNIVRWFKTQFSPPSLRDPVFGELLFMHVPNAPERSYWECEWQFPATKSPVSLALPGDRTGPNPRARDFYLGLPGRFESIISVCRPELQRIFRESLETELPDDIFSQLKLAGFDLENPDATPLKWEISFESTGKKWLGISVPFVDNTPQQATVDT